MLFIKVLKAMKTKNVYIIFFSATIVIFILIFIKFNSFSNNSSIELDKQINQSVAKNPWDTQGITKNEYILKNLDDIFPESKDEIKSINKNIVEISRALQGVSLPENIRFIKSPVLIDEDELLDAIYDLSKQEIIYSKKIKDRKIFNYEFIAKLYSNFRIDKVEKRLDHHDAVISTVKELEKFYIFEQEKAKTKN